MNKRLYRSRKDVMIAGVCGGMAEYFDIDPVIVRLLTVLLVFAGGAAILIYLLGWLIIPKAPEGNEAVVTTEENHSSETSEEKGNRGRLLAGVILLILGFIFLASNFMPWFQFGKLWPLLLIVIGIVVLFKSA
ncbi:MAG TPA: PspC domain-containing protein [candidate division Zixibacteria bacterium]|nr:PspC domain-containing protein [candidate division Zixibacteria bacterium]